mgnify:CR=1 FL=1
MIVCGEEQRECFKRAYSELQSPHAAPNNEEKVIVSSSRDMHLHSKYRILVIDNIVLDYM